MHQQFFVLKKFVKYHIKKFHLILRKPLEIFLTSRPPIKIATIHSGGIPFFFRYKRRFRSIVYRITMFKIIQNMHLYFFFIFLLNQKRA
jgi:hypothetical protein